MSEIPDEFKERRVMSSLAEASTIIRSLAEPYPAGDKVKTAMGRAMRKLNGWTANRVADVWRADPRIRVSATEMDQLRAAARTKREAIVSDRFSELVQRVAGSNKPWLRSVRTEIAAAALWLASEIASFAAWIAPWLPR